ncbi:hypothetical protein FA95DRAFT_769317 [Auriscalpium vulgare]|uniref:Uncharacterized protein n=1 Tax=Auriscalpium vulgare TaxID=40419 RepID=A0ACB8RBV6_9AGAM|nr:hypothetical protein FA95DRAFT_769317 [Auriscalpium vulgare]
MACSSSLEMSSSPAGTWDSARSGGSDADGAHSHRPPQRRRGPHSAALAAPLAGVARPGSTMGVACVVSMLTTGTASSSARGQAAVMQLQRDEPHADARGLRRFLHCTTAGRPGRHDGDAVEGRLGWWESRHQCPLSHSELEGTAGENSEWEGSEEMSRTRTGSRPRRPHSFPPRNTAVGDLRRSAGLESRGSLRAGEKKQGLGSQELIAGRTQRSSMRSVALEHRSMAARQRVCTGVRAAHARRTALRAGSGGRRGFDGCVRDRSGARSRGAVQLANGPM